MQWWEWSSPEFTLGFLAALAGVGAAVLAVWVPLALHRSSMAAERAAEAIQMRLVEVQAAQLGLSRRQRWEYLVDALSSVASPVAFATMRQEVTTYDGNELDLLESALRANPLEPIPVTRIRDEKEARDFIASLPARASRGRHEFVYGAKCLVRLCAEGFNPETFKGLDLASGLANCFPTGQTPGHQFYRDVVNEGSWRLADQLLYAAARLDRGGHAANIITGVLLATKDIHRSQSKADPSEQEAPWEGLIPVFPTSSGRRPSAGWPTDPLEVQEFNESMRQAVATLIYLDMRSFGQWDDEGLTDSPSAAVAWAIRAAGEVASGDDHLELRTMQGIPWMISSLRGRDRGWGTDEADVRHGLTLLRRKCPALWSEYGEELMESAGLTLAAS